MPSKQKENPNSKKEPDHCPTEAVEPENFLTNREINKLYNSKGSYKFTQDDYKTLYNCIHCRECGTSDERLILKQKFLKDGNTVPNLEETIHVFKEHGTPYENYRNRMKLPDGIPQESDTLLYFGCFTSYKVPKYGEQAAQYLFDQGVDFTVREKEICCAYPILTIGEIDTYRELVERIKKLFTDQGYRKIITVCPSCYMVFKKHYSELGIEVKYFTDYLRPTKSKKSGIVSIQHACPLVYDYMPEVKERIETLLRDSGYTIADIPMFCCGGGVGYQLRIDVAKKVAKKRVKDYKGDFVTFYCPDCYWFINVFGKRAHIKPEVKTLFELLTD